MYSREFTSTPPTSPIKSKLMPPQPPVSPIDLIKSGPVLSKLSNILSDQEQFVQLDGNISEGSISSSSISNNVSLISDSIDDTLDEVDNIPSPAVYELSTSGAIVISNSTDIPDFPLIIGTNFRSIGNKKHSLNKLL